MGKEHFPCIWQLVVLAGEEGRDRDVLLLCLWDFPLAQLVTAGNSGDAQRVPSAASCPKPSLVTAGKPVQAALVFFCLAYSLEQTWGEAREGGNPRTWLLPFWKPGAPRGAQLGTGQAQGHSSACKTS